MQNFSDMLQPLLLSTLSFLAENKAGVALFAASALGSGAGAWFGARAVLTLADRRRLADIQSATNVSIAALVALLGKLINFKKDLVAPARTEAEALDKALAQPQAENTKVAIRLELWAEMLFEMRLPHDKLFEYAGTELETVQVVKMLDYNLAELSHLVRQRNELIRNMNAHQAAKGVLPPDGLKLYMKYASDIARNVDENLFFIDRAIAKVRAAAQHLLPENLHRGIADVGLKADTLPLMPPKDLVKGFSK